MHIFIPTNVDSFEEKICKFCHFLYFRSTGVDARGTHLFENLSTALNMKMSFHYLPFHVYKLPLPTNLSIATSNIAFSLMILHIIVGICFLRECFLKWTHDNSYIN